MFFFGGGGGGGGNKGEGFVICVVLRRMGGFVVCVWF